ncbi:Ubiquitin-like protein ATG12 [Trichinella pseudospiralis]|uniref:Ubiquitin-like protein ATG12 n=3 Tax=Trichinella pseudospiralis TaxID=6337 RepID=A0A0V0XE65_TRIPS|nr:Ubiquitin-like protein ATG12 [Trichinella pseudospiralis]
MKYISTPIDTWFGCETMIDEEITFPNSYLRSSDEQLACPDKIEIILKAVGDAPIMKQRKWEVLKGRTLGWVNLFIRRYLKLEDKDSLFLFVSQAFCPSNDYTLENVYNCFGSSGKLVIHYSMVEAWG